MLIHENILNGAFISSETVSKSAGSPGTACCLCDVVLWCIVSCCKFSSLGILWVSGWRISIKIGVCLRGRETESERYTVSGCIRRSGSYIKLPGWGHRGTGRHWQPSQAKNSLTLFSCAKIVLPYSAGDPEHCMNLFSSLHGSYFCDVEIYNTGGSLILSCEFKDPVAQHLMLELQKAWLFLLRI